MAISILILIPGKDPGDKRTQVQVKTLGL